MRKVTTKTKGMYGHILTLRTNWGYMYEDNQTGRTLQTYINKTKAQ